MDLSKPEKKQPKITADTHTSDSQMNQHVVVPTPPNETPPVIMVGEGAESKKADEAIPQQGELVGSQSTLIDAPITPRQKVIDLVPLIESIRQSCSRGSMTECALRSKPAMADGYGFVSNQRSAYRRNSITRNVEITSTHPRNAPKKPKAAICSQGAPWDVGPSSSIPPKFGAWEADEPVGRTINQNDSPKQKQIQFGDWAGYERPLKGSALRSDPALADGYQFVSKQLSADRQNRITHNVEITSTRPHNSPKRPKSSKPPEFGAWEADEPGGRTINQNDSPKQKQTQFGNNEPGHEIRCALRTEPALADGYGFVSKQLSADGQNSITRNVEITSTRPHNSPKKPKQGYFFSRLFG